MYPRASWLALCTLLSLTVAAPSGALARAGRAPELLTPQGWEDAASAPLDMSLALPDDELVVPAGWSSAPQCASDRGDGGDGCSELLVPADWSAQLREHAAGPHA